MKIFKDMDDNQFWMTLWSMAATGFIVLVTSIAVNSFYEDMLIHDLVDKGHDPMELSCLFELGQHNESACLILMQEKAKNVTE